MLSSNNNNAFRKKIIFILNTYICLQGTHYLSFTFRSCGECLEHSEEQRNGSFPNELNNLVEGGEKKCDFF